MNYNEIRKQYLLLFPVIAGCILSAAFFVPAFIGQLLGIICFSTFGIFFKGMPDTYSSRKVFFLFFLAGCIFFSSTLGWLFSLAPLEWTGIENGVIGWIIFLCVWILIVSIFAFWWGVFGVASSWLIRKNDGYTVLMFGIPSIWTLTEYARPVLFGLVWYAPGQSLIGPDVTFGNIAYLFLDGYWNVLPPIGGIYLISFVAACIGIGIAIFVWKSPMNKWKWGVMGLIIACLLLLGALSSATDTRNSTIVTVATVSTDFSRLLFFPPGEITWRREIIEQRLSDISTADIIVLPEASNYIGNTFGMNAVSVPSVLQNTLLVDYGYGIGNGRLAGETLYWRAGEGIFARQGKELLMMGGEYIPLLLKEGLKLFSVKDGTEVFDSVRTLEKSVRVPVIHDTRIGAISALACSEALSSRTARASARSGAGILLLQTSDALFQGNSQYLKYMMLIARMRAAEAGKFLVRASNGGESAFIDNQGRVVESISPGNAVLIGKLPLFHDVSFYARYGDAPILIFIGSYLTFLFFKKQNTASFAVSVDNSYIKRA